MKYLIAFYALLLSATASAQLTVDKFCEYHSQDMLCASAPVDTDGDGIADSVDQCPTVFGLDGTGCPVVVIIPDTDGDGVTDDVDQCPNTYGLDGTGCPS